MVFKTAILYIFKHFLKIFQNDIKQIYVFLYYLKIFVCNVKPLVEWINLGNVMIVFNRSSNNRLNVV